MAIWNLDTIMTGGSSSPILRSRLDMLAVECRTLMDETKEVKNVNAHQFLAYLTKYDELNVTLSECSSFIGCLLAQNTKDTLAVELDNEVSGIASLNTQVHAALVLMTAQFTDEQWLELKALPQLVSLSFVLDEMRTAAKEKLSLEEESLIARLGVDGFQAWEQLYDTVVGEMEIEHDGKNMSVGQAYNVLSSNDGKDREEMFEKWEQAWSEKESIFASILNRIAGFRLSVYESRGWQATLHEPLQYNRMQQATLDAMWRAIEDKVDVLGAYLDRKAKLLGKERLDWYDLEAPLGGAEDTVSYEEAQQFIVRHFSKFHTDFGAFAQRAFDESWIEAEDRPNKRPGGFCTSLPLVQESRIFMTYAGTPSSVSTLAHELGHAYHNEMMWPLHNMNQDYAMNVAETASTFAEMIVIDATIEEASDDAKKLRELDAKLQATVAFLMNIRARFIFETRFYAERKRGFVSAERLNTLMVEAQKEAYGNRLASYHPHFWAS
ncbi:MAG: M3 family oligoendopeptidase, partial [Bacilli bacterium]